MELRFSSKIYLGRKKKARFLTIFLSVLALIISGCVLLKVIVGDFHFSDISGILMSVLLIGLAKRNLPAELIYGYGECVLNFEKERMIITYPDVGEASGQEHFKEVIIIRYDEIDSIEYGKALECFRIVANHDRKRENLKDGKSVQMSEPELPSEFFLYVLEDDMQEIVLKNLARYAEYVVKVIEN